MSCSNIFNSTSSHLHLQEPTSRLSQAQPDCSRAPSGTRSQKRQLVLLEDLPNLLHLPTQTRFQSALQSLCASRDLPNLGPPVVIIVSDSGLRAEELDDGAWDGGGGRRWGRLEVLDIRNVLGSELLTSPYVTHIRYASALRCAQSDLL